MGISTIMKAKQIVLMAWGPAKAHVIQRSVEEAMSPSKCLQVYCNNINECTFIVDEAAAAELTRNKSPWLTGDIEWTPKNDQEGGCEYGIES